VNRQSNNIPSRLSPVLAAALVIPALATALMAPAPLPAQSRELTLLSADVVNLENRVIEIQRTLDARDDRVAGLVEQLADRMAALSSQMERVSTLVDQVRQDTSGLGTGLSVAVRNLSEDMESMERNLTDLRADMGTISQQLTGLSATSSELGDPDNVLRTARTDISQGNYQLARDGYEEFLRSFPTHPRAADAQMGMGDAYYQEALAYDDPDLFQLAVIQYDVVLQRYPNSDKRVDALHKKGLAQIELGENTAARDTLGRLIEEFPESIQALRAGEALDELN
jgi:TolA-binding protein